MFFSQKYPKSITYKNYNIKPNSSKIERIMAPIFISPFFNTDFNPYIFRVFIMLDFSW